MKRPLPLLLLIIIICAAIFVIRNNADAASEPSREMPANHIANLDYVITPTRHQHKQYTGFQLEFNPTNRTPDWAGWELLRSETQGETSRYNTFWTDPDIKGCPDTKDYTRSGYDRGHIVPAADQKWSGQAMIDCFSMANICPQTPALNRGIWQTLEKMERRWAQRDSAIIIIAGPLYTQADNQYIGHSKVRVPSAFFKAFLAPYVKSPRAIAFIIPNIDIRANLKDFAVSVDQLEKTLGFDLFSALPDSIENTVEATFSFKEWNK